MRILVLDTGDPAEVSGGQSVFVRNLLVYSSHSIVVACTAPQSIPLGRMITRRVGSIEATCLPIAHHLRSGRRPIVPERLRCLMGAVALLGRARDEDVLYVHSAELMLAALVHRNGRPIVFHVHGAANPLSVSRYPWARRGLLPIVYGWLWRRLVARMSLVLSVDEPGCRGVREADPGGVRCEVVPPAFDAALFRVDSDVSRSSRRIIYVGRVEWAKRIDLLIGALGLLVARGQAWEAVIVGDGSERAALEASAAEAGVASRCRFLGWVAREDLSVELGRSSLYVLPSMFEGVPTGVLEALACGTPALTRPLEGLKGLIEPGVNGAFWYGEDVLSLVEAIQSAESASWSPGAVAASVERFTSTSVIGRVDELLGCCSRERV